MQVQIWKPIMGRYWSSCFRHSLIIIIIIIIIIPNSISGLIIGLQTVCV